MASAVGLRADYSAAELRRLAASTRNANQSRRLLSLAAVLDGMNRTRQNLAGRTGALEDLAVELYARGLSTRDIEDAFTDEAGRRLLSRAAVSEITERLWAEYEAFTTRDLGEHR